MMPVILSVPALRRRPARSLLWAVVSAICLFPVPRPAWAGETEAGKKRIEKPADLSGKRIGVIAGTILDTAANSYLDYTQVIYFDDSPGELKALYDGAIDAIIDDEPVARYLAATRPRLRKLEENLMDDEYGFAVRQDDDGFYEQVNSVVRRYLADGTMTDMAGRWLDGRDGERVLPELPVNADGRIVRLGLSPVSAPFAYRDSKGDITGLDVEFMRRVANENGWRLVILEMDFSSLIPALLSEHVDIIGSCLSITGERKEMIRFTDVYYTGGVSALVLDD